ncbi:MAG: OsmC family protein, partial [bacterium]
MKQPEEPDETARASWKDGFKTDVSIRDQFNIRVDEVKAVGGTNTGPMPSEMLLASLASCMCLAVSFAADKRDLDLETLSVTADGFHDPDAFRFKRIAVTVSSELEQERLSTLLESARNYCYVSNTI